MQILDCTLRDGANVVGKGFSAELTTMILEGLIESNIRVIEYGNCLGLGAYATGPSIAPLTDEEYLNLAKPYMDKADLGMFMKWQNGSLENIALAKEAGLSFLRVGANAGDGAHACEAIERVKSAGMKARYSLMKAYLLTPEQLAAEAAMLEKHGLDEITIMDSAGTMLPGEVTDYVSAMKQQLNIPIGFHGHNNLGLSVANALAARSAGAEVFDAGLLGMARSAGNCATEVAIAVFQRDTLFKEYDLYMLLNFLDQSLIPAMKQLGYYSAITPVDLVLGFSGCHSSFEKMFREIAEEYNVSLYPLIMNVTQVNKKSPTKELIIQEANKLVQSSKQ